MYEHNLHNIYTVNIELFLEILTLEHGIMKTQTLANESMRLHILFALDRAGDDKCSVRIHPFN